MRNHARGSPQSHKGVDEMNYIGDNIGGGHVGRGDHGTKTIAGTIGG